jgi:hypothetical protein
MTEGTIEPVVSRTKASMLLKSPAVRLSFSAAEKRHFTSAPVEQSIAEFQCSD